MQLSTNPDADLASEALAFINEWAFTAPQAAQILRDYVDGTINNLELAQQLRGFLNGEGPILPPSQDVLFGREGEINKFGARQQGLVEPNTGLVLPAIRKVAAIWQRLDPNTQQLIIQAYSLAGLGDNAQATLGRELDFFTPQGTFRPSQVAGFG